MFFFILFIALAGIICYYFLITPFNYWKNKNVPHPPISYIFGNIGPAMYLKKSLGQIYCEIYEQYPSLRYVGVYRARTPCIILRDLELIREIFIKHFNSFGDNDLEVDEINDSLFAKNPFAAKGERWKETRNHLTPLYTPKRIKEMYPLIDAVCKNMIQYINTDILGIPCGVDAKSLSAKFTTDVVASCALGLDGNSFVNPNSEYITMWKKILSPSFLLNIKLLLLFNFPSLGSVIHSKFVPDDAAAYYRTVVNKTLEYRRNNDVRRGDFLDALTELKEKIGGDSYTNEDVTAHVLGFFIDGTESSSIVLSFVLYELGVHPDIQTKLKNEIDETLQKHGGTFSYDAIQGMIYLDQIINESLRKNATVFFISRLCTRQFSLEPPTEGMPKVIIEPGTPVIVPICALHHDPKYFPNPSRYDPARFSTENKDKLYKSSFLPFGEGPRICLGQRFGVTQVKLAVASLINSFEIRINKKTEVPYQIDPHYFLLGAKGGIWLDFHKRT